MVNEFLKYGGSEVRNKLLKIMNMIFEKGAAPRNFRRISIKSLYMKCDKSEYSGIILSKSMGGRGGGVEIWSQFFQIM